MVERYHGNGQTMVHLFFEKFGAVRLWPGRRPAYVCVFVVTIAIAASVSFHSAISREQATTMNSLFELEEVILTIVR